MTLTLLTCGKKPAPGRVTDLSRCCIAFVVLLLSAPVLASETFFFDNFQDGDIEGWQTFGDDLPAISDYRGNISLRMTRGSGATVSIAVVDVGRVRIGASFAALDLEFGEACIAEATLDNGRSWFTVVRVIAGQDDGVTMHSGAASKPMGTGPNQLRLRAWLTGAETEGTCWLDNVYVVGENEAATALVHARPRTLTPAFLSGAAGLSDPLPMHEYAPPSDALDPTSRFSGSLRLVAPNEIGKFRAVADFWDRVGEVGEPVRHLPEFDFQFAQNGNDILPLQRGVIRREHPYWEIILQPGRAWDEAGDGDWTRASLPFALQERSANCTHNGVLTWLFNDDGDVSRVAYQVSSETCGYFKFDMWGVAGAEYRREDLEEQAANHFARNERHRSSRLPVQPLDRLDAAHPGVDAQGFGVDDGIYPGDISVLGMVVDGIHYRSDCLTRHGPHPYCASLPLPSYSTAKSIFAGVATMRLAKLYPGVSEATIASLIDECDSDQWQDVTIADALDMATGNFRSKVSGEDEGSIPHERVIFADGHAEKLEFACNFFKRKAEPGSQFVYHTSDTYLVGTALGQFMTRKNPGADLYSDILLEPIWRRLGLSPLLDDTKRTYDDVAQPFTGYGLTYEADDIVRIAAWLNDDKGVLDGKPLLDAGMLNASLQRGRISDALTAAGPDYRYKNGFWAVERGSVIGCSDEVWIPFMSGVSGITVALFPNGVIYYYFSDRYTFSWKSAIAAAHEIKPLC